MASRSFPGVQERRGRDGRPRYRVRGPRPRGAGKPPLTRTFSTLEEALAWRGQAVAFAEGRGKPPPMPEPPGRAVTVEDAARRLCRGMLDGSVRTRDGRPYKPSVVRKYEENLRTLVLPRIGAMRIAGLHKGDVQRFVDELAADRTPEHARKALTGLRVALRLAERYDELDQNPCAGVCSPAKAEGETPATILSPEECEAIIAVAYRDDERLGRSFGGPLVALLVGTGLRLGEALALRWGPDGLELDAGLVHVRKSLDRVPDPDQGAYRELEPKSRAARRDVPLPPEDGARLRRHRLASGRPDDGALVFADPEGRTLNPAPAYRAFKRAARRARIAEATRVLEEARAGGDAAAADVAERALEEAQAKAAPAPRVHDCRHAFATHSLAAGLSAHAVAALLGHSDAGLVLRRYGHALPDELAAAGERLSLWRQARAAGHAGATAAAVVGEPLQTGL